MKVYRVINIDVDIVPVDIPFLLGLDVFDKQKMFINTVGNKLSGPMIDTNIVLVRKHGPIYLEWKTNERILYTKTQLINMHRNLSHPTTEKFVNLLKLAKPLATDEETRRILEEIAKNCDDCQRFTTQHVRFKVSLP